MGKPLAEEICKISPEAVFHCSRCSGALFANRYAPVGYLPDRVYYDSV